MTEFCAQEDILNLAKDLTKVDVLFNCAGYLIIVSITFISIITNISNSNIGLS